MTTTTTRPFRTLTSKPTETRLLVTPEIADQFLSHNTHNRPLKNRKVAEFAAAMERGEWVYNGDTVCFSVTDVLLDGQNRLWAISLSGLAQEMLVVTGLPDDVQYTQDRGTPRSLADALRLEGKPQPVHLASALNYLWRQENGLLRTSQAPTIAQAVALLKEHPALIDSLRDVSLIRKQFRLPVGMVTTFAYTAETIDAEKAEDFLSGLREGADLKVGNPILTLRRHLEHRMTQGQTGRGSPLHVHALFIKAWNLWLEGRKVERLTWRSGGTNAEPFPEMHG